MNKNLLPKPSTMAVEMRGKARLTAQ